MLVLQQMRDVKLSTVDVCKSLLELLQIFRVVLIGSSDLIHERCIVLGVSENLACGPRWLGLLVLPGRERDGGSGVALLDRVTEVSRTLVLRGERSECRFKLFLGHFLNLTSDSLLKTLPDPKLSVKALRDPVCILQCLKEPQRLLLAQLPEVLAEVFIEGLSGGLRVVARFKLGQRVRVEKLRDPFAVGRGYDFLTRHRLEGLQGYLGKSECLEGEQGFCPKVGAHHHF